MRQDQIDTFMITNSKYFPSGKIYIIKERMMSLDANTLSMACSVGFKDPTTYLLISIFFPIERFLLGDIGLGILKLLTCGGCYIWTIIDWFTVQDRTRAYNFNMIMPLLMSAQSTPVTEPSFNEPVQHTEQIQVQHEQQQYAQEKGQNTALSYNEQKMKLFEDYRLGLINMEQFHERRAMIDKLKPDEGQYQGKNSPTRKNKGSITLIVCLCIAILVTGIFMYGSLSVLGSGRSTLLTPQIRSTQNRTSTTMPTQSGTRAPARSSGTTYQAIFDEYSQKLRAATPRLLNEYRAEAARNRRGIEGLAEISNAKVEELAEISNEGVSQMAENMTFTGAGNYMEWGMKLNGVYMEEAGKITSAYMGSGMNQMGEEINEQMNAIMGDIFR